MLTAPFSCILPPQLQGEAGGKCPGKTGCIFSPRALLRTPLASQAPGSPSWTAQRDSTSFPNFAIPRRGVKPGELVFLIPAVWEWAQQEDPGFGLFAFRQEVRSQQGGAGRPVV